jgi:hypothetical protein
MAKKSALEQIRDRMNAAASTTPKGKAAAPKGNEPDFVPGSMIDYEAMSGGWGDEGYNDPHQIIDTRPQWLIDDSEGWEAIPPGQTIGDLFAQVQARLSRWWLG